MNMKFFWVENTDGKKDTMLTFSIIAFFVVLFKVLFGGEWQFGAKTFTIAPIDAGVITALLGPTLFAYVARRFTDKKFEFDTDGDGINDSNTPAKKE